MAAWCAVGLALSAAGGTLEDFKKGAGRGKAASDAAKGQEAVRASHGNVYYVDRPWYYSDYWSSFYDRPFSRFGNICYYGLAYGGLHSWDRVHRSSLFDDELGELVRESGEAVIPFLRADFSYQFVRSDIDAVDYSVEGGYGPLGLRFNSGHFSETDPADSMDVTQIHALYRMSLGSRLEIDVGAGALNVRGTHDTRFSFTLPVLYHPCRHFGIECRPTWAGNISEYDIGVLLGWRFVSLKGGYRWLTEPAVTLNGPYAGVSLRF